MDQASDLAIQGTNTSSITSKRSLERLGYLETSHVPGVTEQDTPMMFKYVVPRPSRRSPVINRAYYQRTESIRILVEGWIADCEALGLDECAVISLGCGFDPTFFRLATLRNGRQSRTKLKYVDIDYPTLITERLYMIRGQEKLFDLLPEDPIKDDIGDFISDTYSCLGIDLRKLDDLKRGLEEAGITKDGPRIPILVISEVVLAYLEAAESDAVIKFFADYPEGMHFQRTMTPLKTLRVYQSLDDHLNRFQELGWPSCDIINMNLFTDFVVMPTGADHQRVSQLEFFDEYDELYWIGGYYFIAVATTGPGETPVMTRSPDVLRRIGVQSKLKDPRSLADEHVDRGSYASLDSAGTTRTTSASAVISAIDVKWCGQNSFSTLDINRKGHTVSILGDEAYIFGGFGLDTTDNQENQRVFQARTQQTRLGSVMRLNLVDGSSETLLTDENSPAPRMHHSAVTTLDGSAIYIYGGRDGPTKIHNDVWRFTTEDGWGPLWKAKVNQAGDSSMPKGLYKHTANIMRVAGREMMVVFGGRLESGEANDQVWAFDLEDGLWGHFAWRDQEQRQAISGIFSHSAVVVTDSNQQDSLVVVGGIRGYDERVLNSVWKITLSGSEQQCWVTAQEIQVKAINNDDSLKPRFGHTSVAVGDDRIWVLGGVSSPGLLQWQETMVEIRINTGKFQHLRPSEFKELVMVGHATAVDTSRGRVIGVGGGGTCFGFGAWWDAGGWALQL
ncbi:Leucine carboxyl methyltransferase 2 [Dissophora globulifera]|uniref:tRNA wybutosine-synthesizing protein 4 n=1 Tax=Dissophora globulifera TaxID=979702 RepID=A0A9P6URF1_9FUNG|nr:Leucine carboxyl methyltransferase 2 [Dissophora globulifera]